MLFFFKPFSCMSNHWDGAQIYSCQSPRITTRVTPHSLLILPPLFRQMFGNTDAKREDDHNLRVVLLSCRADTVYVCGACVFLCESLHLINAKLTTDHDHLSQNLFRKLYVIYKKNTYKDENIYIW